jgi:hypothetical protein
MVQLAPDSAVPEHSHTLEDTMSARTTFLSKLIGLYLILISLAMIVHKQATAESPHVRMG